MSDVLCRCPACAAKFKVDAKYSGKKARCPKCAVVVEVPAAGADGMSSTAVGGHGTGNTTTIPVANPVPPKTTTLNPAPLGPAASANTAAHSTKTAPIARPIQSRAVMPPPPREQALEATVEDVVPAQINDTPPQDNFGFQLNTSRSRSSGGLSTSSVAGPAVAMSPHDPNAEPTHRGKKSANSAMPLILAGVVGLVLLAGLGIGAVLLMGNSGTTVAKNNGKKGSGSGSAKAASPKGTGKLVLDWSEDDRKTGFAVLIDGRKELTLSRGELSFDLKAGEHTVLMQRRGFEPVETKVTIVAGESITYKPEWKKNEFTTAGPTIAAKPTPGAPNTGSNTGTNFQVGMASGSTIKGFDGFTQNFHAATENALKAQKNILIIFASSDSDNESQQIARSTQQQAIRDQIQSSFVPVIIDFPRTREGFNNLFDSAQNKGLAEDFSLRKLPTLVLLDHMGKTYYQQSEWKDGTSDLKKYLEEGAAARTERDELWGAVKGETLEPAVKFVTWLIDRKLVSRYKAEVKEWMVVAQRLDGQNEKGQLECFVEADRMVEAVDVDSDDEIGINAFVAPLQDWLTDKRFKDDDRGARLHLMAGGLLAHADRRDDAMKHFARAATYNPKDAKLKEAIASAKSVVEHGNILGFGTGFVVSESGYLMTNKHVIDGKGKVKVRLPDGKNTMVDGKVIATGDDGRDMALVKIEVPAGMTLKPVAVMPSNVGRGTNVAAFGYPKAESATSSLKLTTGGVSAMPDDSNDNMFVLDVRVNPGNSGGPLCDQKGNVVGMVTAKTLTNMFTQEDSYGMAIPSADIVKFLEKYLPADAKRVAAPAASKLEWSEVDAQVSPGVLLIMKTE